MYLDRPPRKYDPTQLVGGDSRNGNERKSGRESGGNCFKCWMRNELWIGPKAFWAEALYQRNVEETRLGKPELEKGRK
jgi:hypothetical protein